MAVNVLLAAAASSAGIVAGFFVSKMAREELAHLRKNLYALHAILFALLVGVVVTGFGIASIWLLLAPATLVMLLYTRKLPNSILFYSCLAVLAALASPPFLGIALSLVFLLGITTHALSAPSKMTVAVSMAAYIALFALFTL
ncbi:hypothetical protein HY642_04705 [Candidatus Woesearchaeota archaeon]|nr:hypothetical protein [Candidatus Woesearchaeota archaeon]